MITVPPLTIGQIAELQAALDRHNTGPNYKLPKFFVLPDGMVFTPANGPDDDTDEIEPPVEIET